MVITCINRFSKMVQLILLQKCDIYTIADKFLRMVVSQHGFPELISSNHNPHFCAYFWEDLMFLLDTTLTFSMVSHSKTDGVAEVINHTME